MNTVTTPETTEGTEPTPEQCDAFEASCREAFGKMIALTRKLKPLFPGEQFKRDWSKGMAEIGVAHDLTEDETWHYGQRILAGILEEAQA